MTSQTLMNPDVAPEAIWWLDDGDAVDAVIAGIEAEGAEVLDVRVDGERGRYVLTVRAAGETFEVEDRAGFVEWAEAHDFGSIPAARLQAQIRREKDALADFMVVYNTLGISSHGEHTRGGIDPAS